MILQKLASAIRRHDWFQVAIEVLIVIVGIYLGLQVSEWADERQDRADEQEVLVRLHEDMILLQEIPSRVMDRRLVLHGRLVSASEVIFKRSDGEALTPEECFAVGDSHIVSISMPGIPSLVELQNEGRLKILQDSDLRYELIKLQQITLILKEMIVDINHALSNLSKEFPEIIHSRSYFDEPLQEYQVGYQCNLAKMQETEGFMAGVSLNVDAYDAYLRDGLVPWNEQAIKVHQMLDQLLGISHSGETS